MKITGLKTWIVGNPPPGFGGRYFVFLKLVADNGIEGVGEAYAATFHPTVLVRMIEDVVERHVIGSDPFRIEVLWRKVYGRGYSLRPDISLMGVMSAVEMALWDIVGKAVGKPVYELLGGLVHERLRSYTYIYPQGDETDAIYSDPDLSAQRAAEYVRRGFTALKFDPAGRFASFDPRQPSLERLEKYEPLWFEEPVPPEMPEEMAEVARAVHIPVATGERLTTKYEFARVLETRAASILQMNLGRVGGLLEAKKIAGMAETRYAQIAPHLYCGPVVGAANLQLAACSPNFLILESILDWGGFHGEILKTPIRWEDGYVIPPTAPGLGVELDEAVAEAHPYHGDALHLDMVDRPL